MVPHMAPKKFLLIDDDYTVKILFEAALEELEQPVEYEFRSGASEALEYLEKCRLTDQHPDFILVDLKMPVMDGFEFIAHYEKQFFAAWPDTRLFVLSSSVSEKDKALALRLRPVRDFITKPIVAPKLAGLLAG
jgi:CheY-like chemotaxis protein